MTATPKIYVIVEGGIVQGVCTNDAALVDSDYTVIDYDADECDPHDADGLADIEQSDGGISVAFVGGGTIERLTVKILDHEPETD